MPCTLKYTIANDEANAGALSYKKPKKNLKQDLQVLKFDVC